MVRAQDFGVDFGGFYLRFEAGACENVIYPPADVARASIGKMAPPRVVAITLGGNAESVHKTGINIVLQALSFFLCVALHALVLLGTGKVVGSMGHV